MTRRDTHGFTHFVRLLRWCCCLWSSIRMAAIGKSGLLLTCNSRSLRFASFTPWACINGIFVSIVFFATYDDIKGSTYIYLERDRLRAPYRHLRMPERCSYDARRIVHIARAPWGNRTNIVRCPYSDRKNRTGIVRFFWMQKYHKIVRRPYCHRTAIVLSTCGARTMLPTMYLQATMPTANRRNITPR